MRRPLQDFFAPSSVAVIGATEAERSAGTVRIPPYNFERVIDPVGFSDVVAFRVHDVVVLAGVAQETNFVTAGIEIGAGDVALIV